MKKTSARARRESSAARANPVLKTFITVCKNTVLQNIKRAQRGEALKPPLRVSRGVYGKPHYARRVEVSLLDGVKSVRVVYDPAHPLPWGARAWVEIS